jgi:hypothetical protein
MMKGVVLNRYALSRCVAAAMLAGCGGAQPPIGASGAMPQSPAIAMHAERGGSRMRPSASNNEDLLYVANEGEAGSQGMDVAILTYPQGQLFGTISGIGPPWGVCSDGSGNVWIITNPDNAYEFAHGDTTPIAYLKVPNTYLATGCSVDRTNGNLAVINSGGPTGASLDVWAKAQGEPAVYSSQFTPWACSYDDKGNLFVAGYSTVQHFLFAELSNGSSNSSNIQLDKPTTWPGGVEWDGKYITVNTSDPAQPKGKKHVIYRVQVAGSTGNVVGTVYLRNLADEAWFWINDGTIAATAKPIKGSTATVGFWRYPRGGLRYRILSGFYDPTGITLSVAPLSRSVMKSNVRNRKTHRGAG